MHRFVACCTLAVLMLYSAPARAQLAVSAGDVKINVGVLGQFQADTIDNTGGAGNTSNLFVRRFRVLLGGQVAKNVTFFVDTDAPNLGRVLPTGKNNQPSVFLQDAFGTFKAADAFMLDAGLMFVPFARNALQSATTLLPIDYGAYTFTQSAPTQSTTGRDTGFQARGYVLRQHLEYRLGAFEGRRNSLSNNGFRYAGRVQLDVFDPEVAFFYPGTYLGKKRVLALGAAFDRQGDYRGYALDAFLDHPAGPGALTAQFDYSRFNGHTFLFTVPLQNDVLVEAGYLIAAIKLTPVVQWQRRNGPDITDSFGVVASIDETRTSVGANFWWAGHNANIKAAYTRIAPAVGRRQNEFTLQLQLFYF